jgi:hypothetical protein
LLSSFTGLFEPSQVSIWIMESLPIGEEAKGGPDGRRGILDIPGVRKFFDSHGHGTGGSPVVVFDDVNIHLKSKEWRNRKI